MRKTLIIGSSFDFRKRLLEDKWDEKINRYLCPGSPDFCC